MRYEIDGSMCCYWGSHQMYTLWVYPITWASVDDDGSVAGLVQK